jgi:phosphate-selective porin OprO/OprP
MLGSRQARIRTIGAAVTLLATASVWAQPALDPGTVEPAPSVRELLNRLEAAERRIAELEEPGVPAAGTPSDDEPGRATVSGDEDESGFGPGKGQPDNDGPAESEGEAEGEGNGDDEGESVTDRLDELRKEWDEYQSGLDEAKAEAAGKPTFDIGGRIHIDHWGFLDDSEGIGFLEHPLPSDPQYGADPESRFLFRRIRLEAEGDVPDLMFWRMQVDFNQPRDPQIKDVYLGWYLPYDNAVAVGNQKRPLGLDAINSSRFNVFMERPLAVEAFNQDARRLGIQLLGYSEDLLFNWRTGVYEQQDVQEAGAYIGDSLQLAWYGRLASTPWYDEASDGRGYLHLAVAGAVSSADGDVFLSDADSNANQARFRTRPEARTDNRWLDTGPIDGATAFENLGLESVLNVGSVQFVGEYLTGWVQRDETTEGAGPDVFFHGGYVYASYFLTGEYMPWDRETGQLARVKPLENFFLIDRCTGGTGSGWGAWQVKARYDYLDLTDADVRGGVENNLTFGLNWWWNAYARLQFDVTRGLIEQHRRVGGYDSGDFWVAGTRFNIDF